MIELILEHASEEYEVFLEDYLYYDEEDGFENVFGYAVNEAGKTAPDDLFIEILESNMVKVHNAITAKQEEHDEQERIEAQLYYDSY